LPTRHFARKYPDSVRIYINETSDPQEDVRDGVDIEIREALRAEGIDIRNKTITVPMARDYIMRKHKLEEKRNEQMRRATQLVTDEKMRTMYYDKVEKELKNFENENYFYQVVNNKVQKIFEEAYIERLSNIYDKQKEA